MQTAKKGFTLFEILIVIVILGILAMIVIPQMTHEVSDDEQSAKERIELVETDRDPDEDDPEEDDEEGEDSDS